MPRTMRDDLTGDFLGRGYDQRMRAEGSSLNIYDSPSRGGALLQSTYMDLAPAPYSGVDNLSQQGPPATYNYTWADVVQESTGSGPTVFQAVWDTFWLNTIYLARNNDTLFIAGTTGDTFNDTISDYPPEYYNLVYAVPTNGSCASVSCAGQVGLPFCYPQTTTLDFSDVVRAVGVTSLAASYVGGVPLLAVGLSDGGVQIYNWPYGPGVPPQYASSFVGMATGDGSQTPPTALAWDPSGSGLLAIGVLSWANEGFFVQVDANGNVASSWLTWTQQGGAGLGLGPLCAAFGQREDGSPVVAFGMTDGTLRLVDPTATGSETNSLAISSAGPGAIVAVNPIPRFDGTAGGSDYAVSYQVSPIGNVVDGVGGLLRWDGTSSGLTAQPVGAGPNTVSPDWDSFREWYPGIKEGRFQVSNTSGETVTVALYASPSPCYGCWYAPSWADAPAFPPAGITLAAGQSSAIYTMGAYTIGAEGGCAAATDATGLWLGYLAITPVSHPADTRLVGLRLNRDMTVDVTDQAGGSTTVSITNAQKQMAAFGLWTVTVGTPPAPTPQPSPTVTGSRVTPADGNWPVPVYRLDVTDATYQLPTPYPNQVMVPPLLVQGSVDGNSWTSLGMLVPATEPAVTAGSPSSPAALTLGEATFWWENPPGQPDYQYIRIGLGPAGVPSQVTLADLPPPADETNLSGPQIAPTSSGAAAPVASGVDQAPLAVQVLDANSNPLPDTDPSYQRIFYRDASGNLITNLFLTGAKPADFIGVSPYPGAYPNDGSVTKGRPAVAGTHHYVSTTNTHDQKITGYVGGALNGGVPAPSQQIEVHAAQIAPTASQTSSVSGGISLVGCTDFTDSRCQLFPISAGPPVGPPALFLDTKDGVQIGILTAVQATTSVASLPLQQSAGAQEHLLASATLTRVRHCSDTDRHLGVPARRPRGHLLGGARCAGPGR
jgi:hypothetical protein